jgi:hypothetical protein
MACRFPTNWGRREERLCKIAEARAKIEARAKERHAREQAEHEAKFAAREAKTAATGKKPGGKPPQPPTAGPLPSDQINSPRLASSCYDLLHCANEHTSRAAIAT